MQTSTVFVVNKYLNNDNTIEILNWSNNFKNATYFFLCYNENLNLNSETCSFFLSDYLVILFIKKIYIRAG